VVALNLVSRSPAWLSALHAAPMYLGLDLRGGVHFMLQVDMQAALTKKAESLAGDIRFSLREKNVRHGGISRNGQAIDIRFRGIPRRWTPPPPDGRPVSRSAVVDAPEGTEYKLTATIKPEAARRCRSRRSSRTSSRCTTGSTSWAWPSR
jgi:preprotein translocase subunit SecD